MLLAANWRVKCRTRVEEMLGGIDYYPKKKKRLKGKLLLLFFAIFFVWFIINNIGLNTMDSVSIIINEPLFVEEISEPKKLIVNELPAMPKIESNVESLDEVIKTYEASSHN